MIQGAFRALSVSLARVGDAFHNGMVATKLRFGDGSEQPARRTKTPPPAPCGPKGMRLMPPTILRQPRARRLGELALAGTVALSVLVAAPRLFGDHPASPVDASASTAPSTGQRDV